MSGASWCGLADHLPSKRFVCQEFIAWEERMFVKPSVGHVRFVGRTRDSDPQQVFAAIIGQDFFWKSEAVGASP